MTNRTLVVAESNGWDYADRGVCDNTTLSCHMSPISSCSERDAGSEQPAFLTVLL